MSRDEAQQKYIDLIAESNADWEQHETLKAYAPSS